MFASKGDVLEISILILIPIYIAYIIFLGRKMFKKRLSAIKSGAVKVGYFKDYQGTVPYELQVYKNHFENQFQFPVIFFISCLAIIQFDMADLFMVFLCYMFFITRLLHSYFHLGSNDLKLRALSYMVGVVSVLVIWLRIVLNLLFF